ncbi:SRPBCC domain-containing protein [Arthrobacter rhombi]|uniref:ArsR/SmtB family transcription factor n=1 Tax=Arthrobacter rhombi TaxID=71253 RepID=UPI0031E3F57E
MGDLFKALGDANRRALLDALKEEDGQSLGRLAERLPQMTRFGVGSHLAVLEDAGLITTMKSGRRKLHYLNAVPLVEMQQRWLSEYTRDAAAGLLAFGHDVEEHPMTRSDPAPRPTTIYALHIRAGIDRVWEALVDTGTPRPWLYGTTTDSSWLPGTAYTQASGGFTLIGGDVLDVDPPRHLRLGFDAQWDEATAAEPAGIIDYLLEPVDDGGSVTLLTVTLWDLVGESAAAAERDTPQIYSSLKSWLETGEAL